VYVRDLAGQRVVTHVFWAEPEAGAPARPPRPTPPPRPTFPTGWP
jgi:hypothetical protein